MRARHKRTAALVTSFAFVLLAAWHYWALYTSLSGAEQGLTAARLAVDRAGLEATGADLIGARSQLSQARDHLARADAHYQADPLLQLARRLPGPGEQVRAVGDFIDIGESLTGIGMEAVTLGELAVAVREDAAATDPVSQRASRLVDQAAPSVRRMEALGADLARQRDDLGDGDLAGPLAAARTRLDIELPALLARIDQLSRGHALLPRLFALNGERSYLVFALNNGELLPGGGLVTAGGVLTVADGKPGRVDFTDSTRWKQSWEAQGGAYIEPPGPLKRYLLRDYTWNLLVSAWSPDFPTWSAQALDFYEKVHGRQQVDGMVAMDLVVLETLLKVTGPKTIEVDGQGPVTFTNTNAVLELERLTRQPWEQGEDRKSVIGDLAQVIIDDLQKLPGDRWAEAATLLRNLAAQRHIQVRSFEPEEQDFISDMGWGGELAPGSGDFLHLSEASVNSTKLNLIVKPEGTYSVDIDGEGIVHHALRLTYHNPLPEWQQNKDPKLVKQLMLGGLYGGYLRVFGPPGMAGFAARVNGEQRAVEDRGVEAGLPWAGIYVPVASGQTAAVEFDWLTIAPGSEGEYRLAIHKQPGTTGVCVALSVGFSGVPAASTIVDGGYRDAAGRICLSTDVVVTASR